MAVNEKFLKKKFSSAILEQVTCDTRLQELGSIFGSRVVFFAQRVGEVAFSKGPGTFETCSAEELSLDGRLQCFVSPPFSASCC